MQDLVLAGKSFSTTILKIGKHTYRIIAKGSSDATMAYILVVLQTNCRNVHFRKYFGFKFQYSFVVTFSKLSKNTIKGFIQMWYGYNLIELGIVLR